MIKYIILLQFFDRLLCVSDAYILAENLVPANIKEKLDDTLCKFKRDANTCHTVISHRF